MTRKVTKRVFSSNLFKVKKDPDEWTRRDFEHMAKCIVRVSKKNPITMVNYVGSGNRIEPIVSKDGNTWGTRYRGWEDYLEFEVELELTAPKTKRKENMDDVITLLLMETI